MNGFAIGIFVIIIAVFWAMRSSNIKSTAQQRSEAQAAERQRLGISDQDANLMHNARRFGILLDTHQDVVSATGQGAGRFTGSLMRVETEGQLTSRVTVTRLLALGFLAFGARKKVDQRELYLTVEGDGFQLVVKLNPAVGASSRQFAALYNTRSGGMAAQSAPAGAPGVAAELESLAKLHADGTLTDEEFAAAKAKLLGTTPAPPVQPQPEPEPEDRRW